MESEGNKNRGVAGLVVSTICLAVITVLVWLGHGDTSTKLFDPSSYYYGVNKDKEVPSPLEMRNRMVIIKRGQDDIKTTKCQPAFKTHGDKLIQIRDGLFAPMVSDNFPDADVNGFTSMTADELNAIFTKDGEDPMRWYCWQDATSMSEKQYILSPMTNFKFDEYSNESEPSEEDGISIAIMYNGNDQQRLVFRNVLNWYCHLDTMDTFTGKHDSLLGAGKSSDNKYGSYSGSTPVILGSANSATYMIFQKKDAGGNWVDCSPTEYYLQNSSQ